MIILFIINVIYFIDKFIFSVEDLYSWKSLAAADGKDFYFAPEDGSCAFYMYCQLLGYLNSNM
jgi:hypothetical protein